MSALIQQLYRLDESRDCPEIGSTGYGYHKARLPANEGDINKEASPIMHFTVPKNLR
jgi:hypothetical protein